MLETFCCSTYRDQKQHEKNIRTKFQFHWYCIKLAWICFKRLSILFNLWMKCHMTEVQLLLLRISCHFKLLLMVRLGCTTLKNFFASGMAEGLQYFSLLRSYLCSATIHFIIFDCFTLYIPFFISYFEFSCIFIFPRKQNDFSNERNYVHKSYLLIIETLNCFHQFCWIN